MLLTKDVELIEGLPAAHIRSIDSVVISDLHLGYEGVMAKRGTLIPKVNLRKILEALSSAFESTGARNLVINGDIKNEFSGVGVEEFDELYDLMQFTKKLGVRTTLIKGNHDNFVDRYREPFNLSIHSEHALIGSYFFFHGDRLPKKVPRCRMMLMGHEHPALSLYGTAGNRERLRCFVYGKYGRTPLLVLPAMGYFSTGNDVNSTGQRIFSPIFKKTDMAKMHAIVCGYGSTIDFGEIGKLRALYTRSWQ